MKIIYYETGFKQKMKIYLNLKVNIIMYLSLFFKHLKNIMHIIDYLDHRIKVIDDMIPEVVTEPPDIDEINNSFIYFFTLLKYVYVLVFKISMFSKIPLQWEFSGENKAYKKL